MPFPGTRCCAPHLRLTVATAAVPPVLVSVSASLGERAEPLFVPGSWPSRSPPFPSRGSLSRSVKPSAPPRTLLRGLSSRVPDEPAAQHTSRRLRQSCPGASPARAASRRSPGRSSQAPLEAGVRFCPSLHGPHSPVAKPHPWVKTENSRPQVTRCLASSRTNPGTTAPVSLALPAKDKLISTQGSTVPETPFPSVHRLAPSRRSSLGRARPGRFS